jgi:hypothetical protein
MEINFQGKHKSITSFNWSVSNPSMINILQQDNTQFEFVSAPNGGGNITITANIPNQPNISRTVYLGT